MRRRYVQKERTLKTSPVIQKRIWRTKEVLNYKYEERRDDNENKPTKTITRDLEIAFKRERRARNRKEVSMWLTAGKNSRTTGWTPKAREGPISSSTFMNA